MAGGARIRSSSSDSARYPAASPLPVPNTNAHIAAQQLAAAAGQDSAVDEGGADQSSASSAGKARRAYKCRKCGELKKDHICLSGLLDSLTDEQLIGGTSSNLPMPDDQSAAQAEQLSLPPLQPVRDGGYQPVSAPHP